MAKQSHIGGEPDVEELRGIIGADVYVSPKMMAKDLAACEKIWAEEVQRALGDGYKGEIRDFHAEGEPWTTGDMRDTWSLCIVKGDKVVAYEHFLPWSRSADDSTYENDGELAQMVSPRWLLVENWHWPTQRRVPSGSPSTRPRRN